MQEAKAFCEANSRIRQEEVVGITDGKAVGTFIEHKFKQWISTKFFVEIGNSAKGIDFPSKKINTDVKTTSIIQPQSSCPFKSARQKIYGLGYNILLFVYKKDDKKEANLEFLHCIFIEEQRTADYQTTRGLIEILKHGGNQEDIQAFLTDRNLPVDEIELNTLSKEILKHPPKEGYLTISNALQWRLQYGRVISHDLKVSGVRRLL